MIDTTSKKTKIKHFQEVLEHVEQCILLNGGPFKSISQESVDVVYFWLAFMKASGYDQPANLKEPPPEGLHGVAGGANQTEQ